MKAERVLIEGQPALRFVMYDGSEVLLDEADAGLARLYWQPHKSRSAVYAERRVVLKGKTYRVRLHKLILEQMLGRPLREGMEVDHINRNPLDNRRSNLREVTRSENERNKVRKHGRNLESTT